MPQQEIVGTTIYILPTIGKQQEHPVSRAYDAYTQNE